MTVLGEERAELRLEGAVRTLCLLGTQTAEGLPGVWGEERENMGRSAGRMEKPRRNGTGQGLALWDVTESCGASPPAGGPPPLVA